MIEQKFTPFMMHHEVYHDKQRFYDLAVEDGSCEICGESVGWEDATVYSLDVQIWHNYWVVDEDMETLYCEECWKHYEN